MQAYLELIAAGKMNLRPLTTRRLAVAQAPEAYRILQEESPRPFTVLLEYPLAEEQRPNRRIELAPSSSLASSAIRLAVLGAGSFAQAVHIPNLRSMSDEFRLETIVNRRGSTAVSIARNAGARSAATDYREALADPNVDAVLIATRHHLHAEMARDALIAGKHVFVEKPLALSQDELDMLEEQVSVLRQCSTGCPVVFVGFNRRYSSYARRLRELIIERSAPIQIFYRMNAGYQPPEHWVHGSEGGGRVLGEACHIFDLFRFLVGVPAEQIAATGMQASRRDVLPTDNFTTTVRYQDGSVCSLLYTAQGNRELPKESMELHGNGWSFVLNDYSELRAYGIKADLKTARQEKGHREELAAFHKAIRGELNRQTLWEEAMEVTQTTLEVDRQVRRRR